MDEGENLSRALQGWLQGLLPQQRQAELTLPGPVLQEQQQEVSFSTRATEGMGGTGTQLWWWLVAAEFCVKQKQLPEVAVLAGKGGHRSKPQPAPAGLHPGLCRAGCIHPGMGIPGRSCGVSARGCSAPSSVPHPKELGAVGRKWLWLW